MKPLVAGCESGDKYSTVNRLQPPGA